MGKNPTKTKSAVSFSMGPALVRISDEYEFLSDCILEMIQNALDAEATKIWILIDKQKNEIIIAGRGGEELVA